jgi:hypothetical protein
MTTYLVASDTHGRLALLYMLAWRYQTEFERDVAGILVSGDLGVWPDDVRLDASTKRHSKTKPVELGFRTFAAREVDVEIRRTHTPEQETFLRRARRTEARIFEDLDAPIYFAGGNHEDYDYLNACARLGADPEGWVPVDAEARIRWIPSGLTITLPSAAGGFRVAALGGIDAEGCGRDSKRYASNEGALLDEDAALAVMLSSQGSVDVLLSHDSVEGFVDERYGAPLLGDVVEDVRPRVHFCGHYHSRREPRPYHLFDERYQGQETLGVHVNTLQFGKKGRVRPNALGVLRHEGDALTFEFAPAEWLRKTTRDNWRHMPAQS